MPRPNPATMTYPTRKNPRLKDYDYASAGAYFVTICTQRKQAIFGQIAQGLMELNPYGQQAERAWLEIPEHFPAVDLDEFIVMPNHMHGIVLFDHERARHASPLQQAPSLGTVVGGFKSAVARWINPQRATPGEPVWQRNYHEHVIRNEKSLSEIREYIANNPLKWELDKYYV